MPGAEFKPRYLVVRHLIHCADLEEPPAHLGALEAKQAPQTAIELIEVLEKPPHAVDPSASDPEH